MQRCRGLRRVQTPRVALSSRGGAGWSCFGLVESCLLTPGPPSRTGLRITHLVNFQGAPSRQIKASNRPGLGNGRVNPEYMNRRACSYRNKTRNGGEIGPNGSLAVSLVGAVVGNSRVRVWRLWNAGQRLRGASGPLSVRVTLPLRTALSRPLKGVNSPRECLDPLRSTGSRPVIWQCPVFCSVINLFLTLVNLSYPFVL